MWVIFSFLAAGAVSARHIFAKRAVTLQNIFVSIWALTLFSFPFALVYLLFSGFRVIDVSFWLIVALRVFIDSFASWTNFKAFSYEEVSYVVPLVAILPLLSAVTSFFINGQTLTMWSLVGMILIIVATVVLIVDELNFKNFTANRNVFRATGYMLATVLIWSLAEALHKKGIDRSSPATYFFVSYTGFLLVYSSIVFTFFRSEIKKAFSKDIIKVNIGTGIGSALDRIFSLNAIQTGLVAYVGSIKTTSIALTAVLASVFLRERVSLVRWTAILTTVLGVILIILN